MKTRLFKVIFCLCACQSTLSSVWCDVGIWWSGHKVFRNIPQPRHEPFPLLASATGKQRLIVLQLTVYNALTHLDNNKLNGETSCIPTPVPASVQSVSGQSFMIEILQRCQHNNTTTNVHFNGSLRRIKFFIPSALSQFERATSSDMFVNSWMMQTADCTFVCAIVWLIFVGVFSKCTDKYELLQRHIVSSAPSAVPWRGVWQWRGHKSHIMPNQNDESLHNSFKSFDLSSVCCIHCLFLKLKCRFMQIVAQ